MEHQSSATSTWQGGGLADGSGTTTLGTGIGGEFAMSWKARTEGAGGHSSPEELLAGAHASCFNMALSKQLAEAGHPPQKLETRAITTFVVGKGVTSSRLTVRAAAPGLNDETLQKAASAAGEGCPISQALKGNVEISVDASLA
ncbi:MAG: OsmC family peroxiredoxin [Actinomycetota bacterium]